MGRMETIKRRGVIAALAIGLFLLLSLTSRSASATFASFKTAAQACAKSGSTGLRRSEALSACSSEAAYASASCKLARLNLALAAFVEGQSSCEAAVRKAGETDQFLAVSSSPPPVGPSVDGCIAVMLSTTATSTLFPYVVSRTKARKGAFPALSLDQVNTACLNRLLTAGIVGLPPAGSSNAATFVPLSVPLAEAAAAAALEGVKLIGTAIALIWLQMNAPKCPACPMPPSPETRTDSDHSHYPCPGAHTHYYEFEYNQNPITCECFLKKKEVRVVCL